MRNSQLHARRWRDLCQQPIFAFKILASSQRYKEEERETYILLTTGRVSKLLMNEADTNQRKGSECYFQQEHMQLKKKQENKANQRWVFFPPTIFSFHWIFSCSEQLLWTSNETHSDRFSKRNATAPLWASSDCCLRILKGVHKTSLPCGFRARVKTCVWYDYGLRFGRFAPKSLSLSNNHSAWDIT